jgi:hypothetical protein
VESLNWPQLGAISFDCRTHFVAFQQLPSDIAFLFTAARLTTLGTERNMPPDFEPAGGMLIGMPPDFEPAGGMLIGTKLLLLR